MNSRRMIILLVAVLAGAMASFAIYTYIGNVKTEAAQGSQMVDVWRVTEEIPKGTSAAEVIERGFIVKEQVEISSRPLTAIDDPAVEIVGLVAIIDIPANVPLVEGLFVEPGVVATGITDRLAERGLVSVTINVDQVHGVANFIEPGDRVNIIAKRTRPGADGTSTATATPAADGGGVAVDGGSGTTGLVGTAPNNNAYIYQYVEVLAVGKNLTDDLGTVTTNPDGTPIETADSGLITFAVPPEAVLVLLNADIDQLYLSLVPQNYVPYPILRLEESLLFPGETEGQLTPYWAMTTSTTTPEENQ